MSITARTITCPICGCPASNMVDIRTDEYWNSCGFCGWQNHTAIANIDDWEKPDYEPEYRTFKIDSPIGAGHYKDKRYVNIQTRPFADREQEHHFRDFVRSNSSNIEMAIISKEDDDKIVLENLFTGEITKHSPRYIRKLYSKEYDPSDIDRLINQHKKT